MQKKYKISLLHSFIICSLATSFYLYEFVLQVMPSIITSELMHDFKIGAAGLGIMTACYYYAYTPMQLPAGMLYDRFGPRRVMITAILTCAIGAFFFSDANNLGLASMGRFFMGIGAAFSFSGALLLISRWFPKNYFPVLSGTVQFMSAIGAICGQIPLAIAVQQWGWRISIHWLGVIGIILAALMWLIIRDQPPHTINSTTAYIKNKQTQSKHFLDLFRKNKQLWLIALYSFAVWSPIAAFAALWGIPFLVTAHSITTQNAAFYIAFIWLGVGIGSPLLGFWSEKIKRRCLPLFTVAVIGIFSTSAIIYIQHLPTVTLFILMFFLGIAGAGQSLTFTLIHDNVKPEVMGTAIGFNNMAIVAGGAIFQPLVGFLLDSHWKSNALGEAPIYTVNNYRWALLILPLCYFIAAIISRFFLHEPKH